MRGRMVPRKPRGCQRTGICHAPLTARLAFRPRGARHIVSLVFAKWPMSVVVVPERCHLLGTLPWQAAAFRRFTNALKILVPGESQRSQAASKAECCQCPSSLCATLTSRSAEATADGSSWVRVRTRQLWTRYPHVPFAGPSEGPRPPSVSVWTTDEGTGQCLTLAHREDSVRFATGLGAHSMLG